MFPFRPGLPRSSCPQEFAGCAVAVFEVECAHALKGGGVGRAGPWREGTR